MLFIESKKASIIYEIKFIPKAKVIDIFWVPTLWYCARLNHYVRLSFSTLDFLYIFPLPESLHPNNSHMSSSSAKYLLPKVTL